MTAFVALIERALRSRPRRLWRTVALLCALASPKLASAQAAPGVPSVAEAEQALDSLRTLASAAARDAAMAVAYRQLGDALEETGEIERAFTAHREALRLAATVRDSSTLSLSHNAMGLLHWRANRYDSALTHLTTARNIRLALGDRAALGRTLNSLGASYYQLGVYEPALDAFLQARDIWREVRDDRGLALVLTNIGKTYHDWRQYERARPVLEEAVAEARAFGEHTVIGYALNTLAHLHIALGNFDTARALIAESLAEYQVGSPKVSSVDSLSGWSLNASATGLLALREGRPADAVIVLDSVLSASRRRGSIRGEARALLHLGEAYRALGQRARAVEVLTHSLAMSRDIEQRVLALEAVELLASVEEDVGNVRGALAHLRAGQALRDTIFDQSTAQRIGAMEARSESTRQRHENARLRAEQSVQAVVIERQRTVVTLGSVILLLAALLLGTLAHFMRRGRAREAALAQSNTDLAAANAELSAALSEVRTLKGLIPICSSCKSVRDDDGYWEAVETYIGSRSDAVFSHSICQSCGPKLYGDHWPVAGEPTVGPDASTRSG